MRRHIARTDVQKELGARIGKLREGKGVIRTGFAARCGLSDDQMKRIEDGEVDLTLRTLIALAGALGTTISSLFQDLV